MRYVIFNKNGKLVLGDYVWFPNSSCFIVGYGTTIRREKCFHDLPHKIVARLFRQSKFIKEGFCYRYEYPENNTLTVSLLEPQDINADQIRSMKGFKKYFGHCNIKNIKIEYADSPNNP